MEAPQDQPHRDDDPVLALLMYRAARALDEAGMTVRDLLDALPEARQQLMREEYGDALVEELERQHAALRLVDVVGS